MVKEIEIEFERGGKFVATLLEDRAPKTSNFVWEHLPFKGRVGHSSYSGKLMYLLVDAKLEEMENAKAMGLFPGDLAFITTFFGKDNPGEVIMVYGDAIVRDVMGWVPANHFARITEGNLEDLRGVATRIRENGRENMTIRRRSKE